MTGYKLTDQNMQTFNYTQWQIGKWKKTDGKGELCGPGWLHYYSDPFLAVLLNPIHAGFQNPRLFEAEVSGDIREDRGLKFGCTKMRLVKELQLPAITAEQYVKFAIYCALEVCADPAFINWANNWLGGTDRTKKTADFVIREYDKSALGGAYNAINAVADSAYMAASCAEPAFLYPANLDYHDVSSMASRAAYYVSTLEKINLTALAQKAVK